MSVTIASRNSPAISRVLSARQRRLAWIAALAAPAFLGPIWVRLMNGRGSSIVASTEGLVLLLLLVTATFTDWRSRKVYNWATYSAIVWGLLLQAFAGTAWTSLAGAAVCFGIMFVPFCLTHGGAGDVKLAAALGSLLGVQLGVMALVYTFLVAGISLLGWTIIRMGPIKLGRTCFQRAGSCLLPLWIAPPVAEQCRILARPVPMAGFFAMGTVWACVEASWR